MKNTLIAISLAVMTLSACDNPDKRMQRTYVTDEAKEERLYLACLDALKLKVKAGEDNLEDALTACRNNASTLSSKYVYEKKTH